MDFQMWDDPRTNRFYQLQRKDVSQWTPPEFQECLHYYDLMIDRAHKKGRKDWILGKKDILQKMERLGIEPYPDHDHFDESTDTVEAEIDDSTKKDNGRIVYIEYKGDSLAGPGRIGRVTFSKTGKTIYYKNLKLKSLKGGYKANYFDEETGEEYWVSGCKKKGDDTLYPGTIEIDEDVREEYWRDIRGLSENIGMTSFKSLGKYSKRQPK